MLPEASAVDFQRRWQELLSDAEPPDWIREMIEYYRRTGTYRPEDLHRLMGDPTRGVEVDPNTSLSCLLASRRRP
ncbi:MAG: hypothetical protein WD229_12235 [Pirellulales bacterium]